MADQASLNISSQISLKIQQINSAPLEHKEILLKDLEYFVGQLKKEPNTTEKMDGILIDDNLLGLQNITTLNTLKLKEKEHRTVHLSNSLLNRFESLFSKMRKKNSAPISIPNKCYSHESISKIFNSLCSQLDCVVIQIMELLNKFFAINSKNLHEKQSNPRAYAPEMKYYIIDTDLQSKFNFRELDEIQKEKKIKYTQLRHAIVYNLTPILESFLNTGLSSKTKRNSCYAGHPWDIILAYYQFMNGDSIINDPILSLLDTYGPSIIKDNGNFGDREHMLFIISKIKSTKGLAEGELFANFVLEGVLRGKLATWIHTICLDWVDIIFYYGDNSFMRCSEIHEIVASLSKLEDININSCF